jgi:hypothetical protein
MKSLLLSTVFLFAGTALFSQSIPVKQPLQIDITGIAPSAAKYSMPNQTTSLIDTADEYIVRATGGTFYLGPNGGYAFGTGYYDDGSTVQFLSDETGLHFDAVGSAEITDLIFWAGAKYINGAADNVTAKIYSTDVDSMPLNLLGSESISINDIDTGLSAVFTQITFTTPVSITDNYFISMEYAGVDDTLGFITTGAGDGLMERRIRQKLSAGLGGVWLRMDDIYTNPFPALDVDLFWAPIYTILDDGIDNHFNLKNATLEAIYPTVASSEIHLDYNLAATSSVSYYIFDLKGRKYFETKSEQQLPGAYSQTFDVSTLAAGNYFVAVTINGQMITQKAVVTK